MKPIFEEERQFIYEKTKVLLPEDCWRNGSKIYLDCNQGSPIYTFKTENKTIKLKESFKKETYRQDNLSNLINKYTDRLNVLEKESIDLIIEWIEYKYFNDKNYRFVLSYSGGKDSVVTYYLWIKALEKFKDKYIKENIRWEVVFANTSNETADTYKNVKEIIPKNKLKIINPKIGFYKWITEVKNYFLPSKLVRSCCSTYKEDQINKYYDKNEKITMILGVRKFESSKRANYKAIMDSDWRILEHGVDNLSENWIILAPIINWKDEEIWLYILKENIKFNKQYRYGFNRVGCLVCPYQADYIDLLTEKYYPNMWKRWVNILKKNYEVCEIKKKLKWNLNEWIEGKWKDATSKEYNIVNSACNEKNIQNLANIKGISFQMAKKYFKKKCKCGKKMNPTELAMFYKTYGRFENIENDLRELLCKDCFCEKENISKKEYTKKIIEYSESGCNLF